MLADRGLTGSVIDIDIMAEGTMGENADQKNSRSQADYERREKAKKKSLL